MQPYSNHFISVIKSRNQLVYDCLQHGVFWLIYQATHAYSPLRTHAYIVDKVTRLILYHINWKIICDLSIFHHICNSLKFNQIVNTRISVFCHSWTRNYFLAYSCNKSIVNQKFHLYGTHIPCVWTCRFDLHIRVNQIATTRGLTQGTSRINYHSNSTQN